MGMVMVDEERLRRDAVQFDYAIRIAHSLCEDIQAMFQLIADHADKLPPAFVEEFNAWQAGANAKNLALLEEEHE